MKLKYERKKNTIIEVFKKSISSTVRAISENKNIDVHL